MKKRITLTNRVVVSDPCYDIPTWCQIILNNVLPGGYITAPFDYDAGGGWGLRNAVLFAVHEQYVNDTLHWRKTPGEVGVDSGQAGIFSYDTYKNDSIVSQMEVPEFAYDGRPFVLPNKNQPGDDWYEQISRMTLSVEGYGAYDQGCASRSGVGDGGYVCYTAKKNGMVVGIAIDFHIIKTGNKVLNMLVDEVIR